MPWVNLKLCDANDISIELNLFVKLYGTIVFKMLIFGCVIDADLKIFTAALSTALRQWWHTQAFYQSLSIIKYLKAKEKIWEQNKTKG